MALVVETGSGSSTAESFISVADADAYHSNRGNAGWSALTTAVKEQTLRKAADYMEQIYRTRWCGYRKTATQALSWPRTFVYLEPVIIGNNGEYPNLLSDSIVPKEVQAACAELALKASSNTLYADQTPTVVSESVGPISVTYDVNSPQRTRYSAIDALLRPYLKGGNNQMEMVRI
jgi:hypothetical protein